MLDLAWTELLLIGIVALIVVGPKELPVLLRNVGRCIDEARGMAREFSRAMEDATDESGVRDVAKTLKIVADPKRICLGRIREATDELTAWKPGSETAKLVAERAEAAAALRAQSAPEAIAAKAESAKAAAQTAPAKTPAAASSPAKPVPKPKAVVLLTPTPKPAARQPAADKPAVTEASAKPEPKTQPKTMAKAQSKAKTADPTAQE